MALNKTHGLTLGSLFDGAGGFPLAGALAGFTPVWASEIEPFPIVVTKNRFPNMKHLGDIAQVNGAEIEPVDVITFGSPCQDLSIANSKRKGLDGERSGLFREAIRIIKEMRKETNDKYPRYIVWENVAGAFSSSGGEDFRQVLEEIAKVADSAATIPRPKKWGKAGEIVGDSYSIAYRLYDAQFWGVPQRRRRIYLVADFAGKSAGKIQFERESLLGDIAQGEKAGLAAAIRTRNGTDMPGNDMNTAEPLVFEPGAISRLESHHAREGGIANTLRANMGDNQLAALVMGETPKTMKIRSGCEGGGKGALVQENKSATLGCNNDQTLFIPKAYGICSENSNSMKSGNPYSGIYEMSAARTLDTSPGGSGNGYTCVLCLEGNGQRPSHRGSGIRKDVAFTLNTVERNCVAYAMTTGCFMQVLREQSPTLTARDNKDAPAVSPKRYIVRRLTPLECCRLQGFPDNWCGGLANLNPAEDEIDWWLKVFETHRLATKPDKKPKTRNQVIKWLANPRSDSAEYKMWGNSIAIPCAYNILAGIAVQITKGGKWT